MRDDQPIRILVLEDDPELRNVLETVLLAEGYQVTSATGGYEAVDVARREVFDLVVADIRMEGMDGLEALENIQAEQPEVRSLVVTGYSTEADSVRAIRLGVSDYLTKPFRLDAFLDAIHAVVAKRRLELERAREQEKLRSTLVWATQRIAAYVDREERSDPSLAQLAAETERLGRMLGWSQERWEIVQLATLLAALGVDEEVSTSGRPLPAIPPAVARVLRHRDERWDGQGGPDGLRGEEIPVEARLATMVLAGREGSIKALAKGDPGRFDPRLLSFLEQDRPENKGCSEEMPAEQVRGLLSLAKALFESGQVAEAEQAIQAVIQSSPPSREKVEALLILARGATPASQQGLIARALEEAETVGPWTVAWANLRSGLLLRSWDPEAALAHLTSAGRAYQQMGNSPGQALSLLGLDWAQGTVSETSLEPAVETLLRPENRSVLVESASWLLIYLLERSGEGDSQRRLLRRTLFEAPRVLSRLVRQGLLGSAARVRAVEQLGGLGGDLAKQLLETLSTDLEPEVREAVRQALRRETVEVQRPLLRIYSMGPLEVYRGERRIHEDEWRTSKTKYMFALLAAGAGRPVVQDKILDIFWPDDVEKGTQSLYWSTSVLRRVLRSQQGEEVIARSRDSLMLNTDIPRWHDLEELNRLTKHGKAALESKRVTLGAFRPLLDLYRGPYLEGYYGDWAEGTRTRLALEAGQLLLALSEYALENEQAESALEFSKHLVEIEPCHLEGHMAALKAMSVLGRHAQLLQHYEAMERRLRQDMELEPTIPMLELYHRAKLSL